MCEIWDLGLPAANEQASCKRLTRNLMVLITGGLTTTEHRAADDALNRLDTGERLVLATCRFLGEGSYDAFLDTLFLTSGRAPSAKRNIENEPSSTARGETAGMARRLQWKFEKVMQSRVCDCIRFVHEAP